MFVRTKHKIDKRHEFALVVVNDDALWVSSEQDQLILIIQDNLLINLQSRIINSHSRTVTMSHAALNIYLTQTPSDQLAPRIQQC